MTESAQLNQFCTTGNINMTFWPMLGGIAVYLGKKLIDTIFDSDDKEESTSVAVTQLAQTNWNDILQVCDGVLNRNVEPLSAIGNMRTSLQEQDPRVIKMALKVLESVLEERGIPARTDEEASQFLRDMRQLLRDTRDRDVMDGVFELNDAWGRACRNSNQFRGVGDLIELLNAEGYRVLVTRDSRDITNENTNGAYCDKCDSQLPFDQLKHLCQYCRRIFCSSCCSYQRGISPFQGNSSVCICHECRTKNNSNFSPQTTADYRQTTPKVYNNVRDGSFVRSAQQPGREAGDNKDDEDVRVNLVVPRHVAENPEGWKISVQCTKTDNASYEDSTQKGEKENNDLKWTLEHPKDKLFEKDVWQANSDSKKIVTKSSMENNKYMPSEQKRRESAEEEVNAVGRQNSTLEEEREEEYLHIALERSRQTAMEDMEMRLALEISRRQSEEKERKSAKYEVSDGEEDTRLRDTRLKKKTNKAKSNSASRAFQDDSDDDDDDQIYLDITDRQRLENNRRSRKGLATFEVCSSRYPDVKNRHRSKEYSEKSKREVRSTSGSEDNNDVSEEESTTARKPKCCSKHAKDKKWEEDEALARAIRISLKEFKQEPSTSGSENNDEDTEEENALTSTPGPSYRRNGSREDKKDNLIHDTEQHVKQGPSYRRNGSREDKKDNLIHDTEQHAKQKCYNKHTESKEWEEQEALERAIKLSLKESKQERSTFASKNNDEDSEEENAATSKPGPSHRRNKSREDKKDTLTHDTEQHEKCCCKYAEYKEWEEQEALDRAIKLSLKEFKQVAASDSKVPDLVFEQDSEMKSAGKLCEEEELRQKRLRYFSRENTKEEEEESLGHSSKQDAKFSEENDQCEEECHTSSSAREKISMIEEAEVKLAMQLSLQEMLEKEQDTGEESEDKNKLVMD